MSSDDDIEFHDPRSVRPLTAEEYAVKQRISHLIENNIDFEIVRGDHGTEIRIVPTASKEDSWFGVLAIILTILAFLVNLMGQPGCAGIILIFAGGAFLSSGEKSS